MNPTASHQPTPSNITRRTFVQGTIIAGAGVALGSSLRAESLAPAVAGGGRDLNVAIVGVGRQGKILLDLALKIPGIRLKAVCDIWSYSQAVGKGLCAAARQQPVIYDDYRAMLSEQKDLDAVIVATPDIWHAPVTNDCLKAGKHVYCEKEMSNTLEGAASMVRTQRQTGKLLQVGHQRRSNPYYLLARNIMHKENFCGTIRCVEGQWAQLKPLNAVPPKLLDQYRIPDAALNKWGYASMQEFRDWRWFKKLAGGPMTDLGSHQVDVFNWFLGAAPKAVTAWGGNESAVAEARANAVGYVPESFDHTMCIYEWDTADGPVRGFYMVNLTSSYGGFSEQFMGRDGTIVVSEITNRSGMSREFLAKPLAWEDHAKKVEQGGQTMMQFDTGPTGPHEMAKITGPNTPRSATVEKPAHQPHLENFFAAIRDGIKLTCPPDVAYETAVSVIKANESALTGKRIEFKSEDFKVT